MAVGAAFRYFTIPMGIKAAKYGGWGSYRIDLPGAPARRLKRMFGERILKSPDFGTV